MKTQRIEMDCREQKSHARFIYNTQDTSDILNSKSETIRRRHLNNIKKRGVINQEER